MSKYDSKEIDNKDVSMEDVIKTIIQEFGEEILLNEKKFLNIFKDYAPKMTRETKMLSMALELDIAKFFVECPVDEREANLMKARNAMQGMLTNDLIAIIIKTFTVALGWSESSEKLSIPQKEVILPEKEIEALTGLNAYEKATSCMKAHDYIEAMKWYRKAADAGNTDAMDSIGDMYLYGKGVIENHDEADEWYRKAADGGNAHGCWMMADMYCYEVKDYKEAMKWYHKAADAGSDDAIYELASIYEEGEIVPQDYCEAMKWYRKSADTGYAGAMDDIGRMYEKGLGVEKNYDEAMKWYRKAASKSEGGCRLVELGQNYELGRGVVQDYGEAMKWYQEAANLGNHVAMKFIGFMYAGGRGVTQNYAKAMEWYRKAAENGDLGAMIIICQRYLEGIGVPHNRDIAVEWYIKTYKKAIEEGRIEMIDVKEQLDALGRQIFGDSIHQKD